MRALLELSPPHQNLVTPQLNCQWNLFSTLLVLQGLPNCLFLDGSRGHCSASQRLGTGDLWPGPSRRDAKERLLALQSLGGSRKAGTPDLTQPVLHLKTQRPREATPKKQDVP